MGTSNAITQSGLIAVLSLMITILGAIVWLAARWSKLETLVRSLDTQLAAKIDEHRRDDLKLTSRINLNEARLWAIWEKVQ